MRNRISLLIVAMTMSVANSYAQTYWVQPGGVDSSSGGTSTSNPLRTIQFAINLAPSGSTIRLMNGAYSPATNGESFPISVYKDVTIQGDKNCGALVEYFTTPPFGQINTFDVSAQNVTFADFELRTDHYGIAFAPTQSSTYEMDGMYVTGYQAVNLYSGAGNAGLVLNMADCNLRTVAPVNGLPIPALDVGVSSDTYLNAERCDFATFRTDGTAYAARLRAFAQDPDNHLITSWVNCVFHNSRAGVFASVSPNSPNGVTVDMDHCTVAANGAGSTNDEGGVVASTQGASYLITDSLFSLNGAGEMRDLVGPLARFGVNTSLLRFDPVPPGGTPLGFGNLFGATTFVDVATGDLHLMPGNTAIDMPTDPASTVTDDWDGDGRSACQTPNYSPNVRPDAGADEYQTYAVYLHPRPTLGGTSDLVLFGVPGQNEAYQVWSDVSTTTPQWCGGLLTNPYTFFSGNIPTSGVVSFPFTVTPAMLGAVVPLQSIQTLTPNQFRLSNVHVSTVCP